MFKTLPGNREMGNKKQNLVRCGASPRALVTRGSMIYAVIFASFCQYLEGKMGSSEFSDIGISVTRSKLIQDFGDFGLYCKWHF